MKTRAGAAAVFVAATAAACIPVDQSEQQSENNGDGGNADRRRHSSASPCHGESQPRLASCVLEQRGDTSLNVAIALQRCPGMFFMSATWWTSVAVCLQGHHITSVKRNAALPVREINRSKSLIFVLLHWAQTQCECLSLHGPHVIHMRMQVVCAQLTPKYWSVILKQKLKKWAYKNYLIMGFTTFLLILWFRTTPITFSLLLSYPW